MKLVYSNKSSAVGSIKQKVDAWINNMFKRPNFWSNNPTFLLLLIKPKSVTIYYDRVVKSYLYNTETSAKLTISTENLKS